ncbi:hypothetical protein [Bartonella tribocorum]|uniref:Phage protein n=1 Tax=Bartonella tribocorum (strain DSM 28219 / CCUG 45778 / CIP 105476 / IBS 506) TaxID=382640 RepID=A9IPF2_BART1|nr:hypothetical protein [Bartonella tribocorum]CAK00919.1 hypothetical protein BT_0464 [Bartonella tribocorum CIP 105476]CDO48119.1 hypothetical protein BM1374166_00428 [Bartonella tribocorum]
MEEEFTPEEQAIYDEHFASDHAVELVEPEQVEEVFEAEESFEQPPVEPVGEEPHSGVIEQERQARQKAEQNAMEARELAIEFAQKYAQMQEEVVRRRDENIPTLEDDPKAHVAWLSHKVQEQQKLLDEFSRIRESQERLNQEEYERQQLGDYFEESKAQVQDKYPDLDSITDYLYERADSVLQAQADLYPQWRDPAARQQQIGAELRQICQQCQKASINPIEVLVQKAKAFGYSGAPIKDDVETLQERSQAARTLTARGGQVPTGGMDVKTLFSMPEAEFAVWVEKNPEKFEQIMSRA